MPGGTYPDGMAFVRRTHKLYVSDEHGGSDTVIIDTLEATIGLSAVTGDYRLMQRAVSESLRAAHRYGNRRVLDQVRSAAAKAQLALTVRSENQRSVSPPDSTS
jgi:hypothetical protein